jgi:hypothetical protein
MSWPVASRWRDVGALAVCVVLGWTAFTVTPRVPVLALVDLGFAQLGHLVAAAAGVPLGDAGVLVAVAGPLAQVAVPVALALHFLSNRWERSAGAVCLAWAATSLTAVSADVVDAAGGATSGSGPHDWSVLLAPDGLVPLDRAAGVAALLEGVAVLLLVAAVVVCLGPLVGDVLRAADGPAPPPQRWASSRRV